jgi:hypothetical protein
MASTRTSGVIAGLAQALGLRGAAAPSARSAGGPDVSPAALAKLWWLTDVPAFIDERLVDKLYNAIVRPEFILVQSSEKSARTRSRTWTAELETLAGISLPAFLKIESKARANAASPEALSTEAQVTKQYVHSAERRLQEIVSVYVTSYPDRLLFDEVGQSSLTTFAGESRSWDEAEGLLDRPGPRPMLFIDLAPRVPILPMSGGSQSGKPVLLIDTVVERLRKKKRTIPDFPRDNDGDAAAKRAYWNALIEGYDNWTAMDVINEGFGAGERIEWIDFRMKLGTREMPVHLHFTPAGTAPTGDFAYNLVRRGFKVGLRLVGQLKKGCDVNVLALYQR